MLTQQQQAEHLVNQFYAIIVKIGNDVLLGRHLPEIELAAKKCAKVHVEKTIESLKEITWNHYMEKYWADVVVEIDNYSFKLKEIF